MDELDLPHAPSRARSRGPFGRRFYAVAAGVVTIALVAGGVIATRGPGSTSSVSALDTAPLDVVPDVVLPTEPSEPSGSPSATASATVTASPTAGDGSGTVGPALPVPTVDATVTATVAPSVPSIPSAPVQNPHVQVSVSDGTLPTATKMIVTVRFRAVPGYYVEVSPGDGHPPWTTDACYHREREDVTYGKEWVVARYEWSYRRAGTYDITAELLQYPCHGGSIKPIATSAPRRVRVTQGANVANGPWLPHLDISYTNERPPSANADSPPERVWGGAATWDADGWLWKFTTDWGDGSAPELTGGFLEDCWISGDGTGGDPQPYPDTTWPWGGHGGTYGWHDMPGPGTYTVTVTAYSSNCDGGDVQVVTKTAQVTVPG